MKHLSTNMREVSQFPKEKQETHSEDTALQRVKLVTIDVDEAGQRIDNYLMKVCKGVPKSHIYRILRSGEVRVNKGRVDQLYRLVAGDEVRIPPIRIAQTDQTHVPGCEFPILFEDKFLLIIDKPAGVAVHGGSGVSFGVIEQLRAARPQEKFLELVHRLDRETSGVLLIAKKRTALTNLHDQMRDGVTDKRYLTMVSGDWRNPRQHIKLPLHKYTTADGERRVRVQADGMASHTIFSLRKKWAQMALLEAELKTGRTHQIRVHLSSSGFPILGDEKYGDFSLNKNLLKANSERGALKRMFLHAWSIEFVHPENGKTMKVTAELPTECRRFIESITK